MTLAVDHVCWAYDDLTEFQAYAAQFLSVGAAAGEFTWYVGAAVTPEISAVLGGSGRFVDVTEAYPAGAVIEPEAQVAAYAAATEAVLAAGYTGLRVAAEVGGLVGSPAQLDAFARYEFAIGRYMMRSPMRAVCGYDRGVLGDAVAEVACLHPRSNPGSAPFHLHPAGPERGDVFLDGELDAYSEELLASALRRSESGHPGGAGRSFVVHADGLRFVDHRSLLLLEQFAARRHATAVLRTPRKGIARLAGLLELERVRVEVVA
jgi:hypothetical protein